MGLQNIGTLYGVVAGATGGGGGGGVFTVANVISASATGTLFTFPATQAQGISIEWDEPNQQPRVVNSLAGQTINYTFDAWWNTISLPGFPDIQTFPSGTLAGVGNFYLTTTLLPVLNVDLSEPSDSVMLYMDFGTALSTKNIMAQFRISKSENPVGGDININIVGFYGAV